MYKISKNESPLVLLCLGLFVLVGCIFFDVVFSYQEHLLYTTTSLLYILLASSIIFIMSFFNSLTIKVICFLLSAFYTQRVITTYILPSEFDYYSYVGFTHEQIELSSLYYLGVVVAMFLGLITYRFFFRNQYIRCLEKEKSADFEITQNRISYFGVNINFDIFIKYILYFLILCYMVKVLLLFSGFAGTGEVINPDNSIWVRLDSFSSYLSVLGLVAFFYYPSGYSGSRIRNIFMFLFICVNILLSSRALILTLLSTYIFVKILSKQKFKPNILWFVSIIAIFSIFIFYPVITIFRGMLLTSDYSLTAISNGFVYYFENFSYILLNLLERFGGFDWLTLWLTIPPNSIPPNGSLFGEAVTHLNSLVPGELYTLNGSVNLAKMQVVVGRGYGDLNEIGGHQETMGGLATSYVYFSAIFGALYFFVWSILLLLVEHSKLHVVHKFVIINAYCFGFLQGGGFILMHQSVFYYLILSTVLIVMFKSLSSLSNNNRSAVV